jgi:hypothetical protein
VHRGLYEVTTLSDRVPRFMPGGWNACCGYLVQIQTTCLGALEGPPVPTPEDILRAAGLHVL